MKQLVERCKRLLTYKFLNMNLSCTFVSFTIVVLGLGSTTASFLECERTEDCTATNSYCDENNLCQCPTGQVMSTSGKECVALVVGYGEPCFDDNQCSWLLGKSTCRSGRCSCADGWWYFDGRCNKGAGLGESCNSSENCYNGYDILAMVCSEGVCSCNSGYYLRGNYDCRPSAEEEGDYCSLDADCASLGRNYVCRVTACVLSEDTISTTTTDEITTNPATATVETTTTDRTIFTTSETINTNEPTSNIPTTTSIITTNQATSFETEVTSVADTTTTSGIITPTDSETLTANSFDLATSDSFSDDSLGVEETSLLSVSNLAITRINCTNNIECNSIANSNCYPLTKTCVCRRGYFYHERSAACVAELGVNSGCSSNSDCRVSSSRCLNGTCYCRKTYFTMPGNSACQKPMSTDNLWCSSVARCYVMGALASCRNNQCACSSLSTLDENYICRRETNSTCPSTGCSADSDCTTITNSVCDDGRCVCPDNYRLEDSTTCSPNLGARCDNERALCTINHASCTDDNLCQCDANYITAAQNTTCYKVAETLGESCQVDQQCSATVLNSVCANGNCSCDDGYTGSNGTCYVIKDIGSLCERVTDCRRTLGQNVYCRNGICQCLVGMRVTEDGLDCTSGGTKLTHSMNNTSAIILILCSLLFNSI